MMSNPCDTVDQCIEAIDCLNDEIRRATDMRRSVTDQLTSLVIDQVRRGELPREVLKVDIGFIKRFHR